MPVIKNRQLVHNPLLLNNQPEVDPAQTEDSNLSNWSEPVLISIQSWKLIRSQSNIDPEKLILLIKPTDEVQELAEDIAQIPIIVIRFDSFTEGRGYSQAVELRKRLKYTGELRALGACADNLAMLERCGFDAFELEQDVDPESLHNYFDEIDLVYHYN